MCQALYLRHLSLPCDVEIIPILQWKKTGDLRGNLSSLRTPTAAQWKRLDLEPGIRELSATLLSTQ